MFKNGKNCFLIDDTLAIQSEIVAEFEKEKLFSVLTSMNVAQVDSDIGWVQIEFPGNDIVIFSSVSYNVSVRHEFKTRYSGTGIAKVSGRQFSEYVRQLPPATVHMKAELPYKLNLKCGGSSARLQLVQDQSVTHVHPSEGGTCMTVKGSYLERWISTFKDFVSVDDSRFYANGALIWAEAEDGGGTRLNSIASDAHRLSSSSLHETVQTAKLEGGSVLLPRKALEELRRIGAAEPNTDFVLKWQSSELSFSAEIPGYIFFAKCIAGYFPPYEAAFPQKINLEVTLDLKLLQDCVKRAMLFSDKDRAMVLHFEGALLTLSSFTPGQKEGEEVIEISSALDSPFEVNYNGDLLACILNSIPGTKVHFAWESVSRPIKITGEEQKGLSTFYLLVPVRF